MTSRLERLLLLLDTGSTPVIRSVAAKQLGEIHQTHPHELQNLLQKVYVFLRSRSWETRIAAGEAIMAMAHNVPLWGNKVEEETEEGDSGLLNFSSFSLHEVLECGTPLLGSGGKEYEATNNPQDAAGQKQRLQQHLGLNIGNVELSDPLFGDEDFAPSTPTMPQSVVTKNAAQIIDRHTSALSARERNKAKRKAKMVSRQKSLTESSRDTKRCKLEREESVDSSDWAPVGPNKWPFEFLVSLLLEDLFSLCWEERHGAAVGIRSIIRRHRYTNGWLIDLALRLISVLALDRFGDYVSHEVVAPVRETVAQCLGVLTSHLTHQDIELIQVIFLQLLSSTEWQARHGGLLAIKYLLAARQDIGSDFLEKLLPHILRSVSDDDDDVRAVAAASLIPVAHKLPSLVSDISNLIGELWKCLSVLDDLSASTNSIMSLLSALLRHYSNYRDRADLALLTPRLAPFLSHNIRSVRIESVTALSVLLETKGEWINTIAPLFARCLYQRLFLEDDMLVRSTVLQVWPLLLSNTEPQQRTKIVTEHLPLWFHLIGAPPGLPLDKNLFLEHHSGLSVSMPQGPKEIVVKSHLSQALGQASYLTSPALFSPLIKTFLTSTCASYRQAACLIVMKQALCIEEKTAGLHLKAEDERNIKNVDKNDLGDMEIVDQLKNILAAPMQYDELSVHQQSLQNTCQGLLSDINHLPASQHFRALPVFSVEHALGLVKVVRQSGTESIRTGAVESLALSLQTSASILNTRSYSGTAGCLVLLKDLPDKLNPVIKPLMDCIKKETSVELQELSAKCLARLTKLISTRTPCPTPKIIKNLIAALLSDDTFYPSIASTSNPAFFSTANQNNGSNGSSTVSTPTTPQTPQTFSPFPMMDTREGIVTHLKYATLTSNTAAGRGRKKDEPKEEPTAKSVDEICRRGVGLTITSLANLYTDHLFTDIPEINVLDVIYKGVDDGDEEKLVSSLYVLESLYTSLSSLLQQQVLDNIGKLPELCCHGYTAVRHAAARVVTTLATVHPVLVFNHLLTNTVKHLESSELYKRQGVAELLHLLVKKLDLDIVPYVILLMVPILRRMGDGSSDVRGLCTLTFAQLVRYMPLDGVSSNVHGLLPELVKERSLQKVFLDQLMDPSQIEDCKVAITINAELRHYQQEGVNWLWFLCKFGLHGILCDDMGLGKTLQTLCIIGTANKRRGDLQIDDQLPSLVVCPPTLIGHWLYETEKFVSHQDLQPLMYCGSVSERSAHQATIRSQSKNLIICSYDVLRNDCCFFSSVSWNYVVLDEGHIIKNPRTRISRAAHELKAQHRLILSGTPIQNNVLELWGLFEWLMPGYLGTEKQFNRLYSKPITLSRDAKSSSKEQEAGAVAMETLHRQVLPFLLRRMKEDVLKDLPPKIIQDYYCEMSPLQSDLYDKFSQSVDTDRLGEESNVHVFKSLHYLRKLCNHPLLVLPPQHAMQSKLQSPEGISHSGKLLALKQLLIDCGIGDSDCVVASHRALVFCQLKSMLDIVEQYLLKQHLPNVTYLRMDGSTPPAERAPLVNKFNSDPSIDLLLLTTSVGGLGLNLSGADTVIFVEHDWNPSKDLQAMDRAHRIGQKRVVNVYRLITKHTIEEKIMGLQKFKLNIANTVISAENVSLKEMGNCGLLDLFTSDKEKTKMVKSEAVPGKGLSSVLADVGQLWEDDGYEQEYSMKSFMDSIGGN